MKLISTTKLVLEQKVIWNNDDTTDATANYVTRTFSYADFLIQPLTIGMIRGKNKLFEDFKIRRANDLYSLPQIEVYGRFLCYQPYWGKSSNYLTVEDLIKVGVFLTKSAQKQLGF